MNPDLDLTLERVIRAPRAAVWSARTDPSRFEKWWVPAPTLCRVDRLDVRPGGALVTRLIWSALLSRGVADLAPSD
jgi:uncharacterized protein YndB with AHSA1/START domain